MAGLIVTRKKGEALNIGDDIVVTVLDVGSNSVRLRIEAPADVPVHRDDMVKGARHDDAD